MLTLTNTSHTLSVITSSATNIDVFLSYIDPVTNLNVLKDQQTLITTATTTVILDAPSNFNHKYVKTLIINNTSASSNNVTVTKFVGATGYDLFTVTLGANESLHYTDVHGWKTFNNSGASKESINQGSSPISVSMGAVVLASNVVNNNATANTIASITGLGFSGTVGTYWFRFIIWYTAAATTTGARFSITGPANSRLGYRSSVGLSAGSTAGTDVMTDCNVAVYDSPAASSATSPTSTAGQANTAIIEGLINITSDGDVVARFASEIANSAITALAGSVVYYQKLI